LRGVEEPATVDMPAVQAGSTSAGPGSGSPGRRARRAWRRLDAALTGLPDLVTRNWLFGAALGAALLLRLITMVAYQPAVLIRLDSYIYLLDATHLTPDPDNPDGYPFFLWLLKPFHSLSLVAGLQHLLGLGVAVMVYAVLRRYAVPRWGATLAAAPVLFDRRELLVEHSVMSDTLATFLMIAAFAVLLRRGPLSMRRAVVAGLLMGASSLARPTSLPLIVMVAVYLLVIRAGWRRAGAALLAGVLPLAAYAMWFSTAWGTYSLTNSSGLFLWSRTMSFANCAIIKPPPHLVPLCPQNNPALPGKLRPDPRSWSTLGRQETPQDFLWTRRDWPWRPWSKAAQGYQPYWFAFTPGKNARAQAFAVRAIAAQPLDYALVVTEGVAATFLRTDYGWKFPTRQHRASSSGTYRFEVNAVQAYTGSTAGIAPYLGAHIGTRLEEPYAHLIGVYQGIGFLPGVLFALVFAVGLAGLVLPRRRTGAAVLLWVSAVTVLVLPVAGHQYNYRYALAAVPLACMVVALVAADPRHRPVSA
jgi:hypothetical protein